LAGLLPKDAASLREFRRVVGTALRVMIHNQLPRGQAVDVKAIGGPAERDGIQWQKVLLGRQGEGEQIPAARLQGTEQKGTVVVWVHPAGKSSLLQDGKLVPAARQILDMKAAILAPDVFLTGEFQSAPRPKVNDKFAGYTFGYNRPLVA